MRKALVQLSDGLVVNVIEVDEGAKYSPPLDHELRDSDTASPGDTWDGLKFVKPPPPEPEPDPDVELISAIGSATTLAELKSALLGTLVVDQKGVVAARKPG